MTLFEFEVPITARTGARTMVEFIGDGRLGTLLLEPDLRYLPVHVAPAGSVLEVILEGPRTRSGRDLVLSEIRGENAWSLEAVLDRARYFGAGLNLDEIKAGIWSMASWTLFVNSDCTDAQFATTTKPVPGTEHAFPSQIAVSPRLAFPKHIPVWI